VWAEAMHPGFVAQNEPVNIQPNGETTKDFVLDAGKIKPE